jgi:multicomponent Na+:H+ antiporter subunit D
MLLAYILVPLIGAAVMPIIRKVWAKASNTIAFLIVTYLVVVTGGIAYLETVKQMSLSIHQWVFGGKLLLSIDGLSLVVLLAIGLVALASIGFSAGYPIDPDRRPGYNALILLAVSGMNGLVMAADIFSLYVFLEIVSISSFVLIAYQYDREGIESSFKYMMLSAVATIFLLFGIAIVFATTGNIGMSEIAAYLKSGKQGVSLGLAFMVFAFGVKAGMMPFHGWLPDAYTGAPAPVSILLAGIVTKVAGVYTLMRLVLAVFGFSKSLSWLLLMIGALSTIMGAFMALGQKDFKRMLAFSSISQIGYMVMGFATGTPLGMMGAVFHLFNHSVFKSLL